MPGSNRFNGSFQAGQGINHELQNGNAFRVSPRIGFVYDLTGKSEFIVRGGFGIFYDRPQGNMVFNMITNAPGVLQPTLQWGRLQGLTAATGDPDPVLTMNPTAYDFKPPTVYQWNLGMQRKLWKNIILDVAYVGSDSKDLLRGTNINARAVGRDVPGAESGSNTCGEQRSGLVGAADRSVAAVPGLRQHRLARVHRLLELSRAYKPV